MGGLTSALAPILQIGTALGTVVNAVQPFYSDSVTRKQQQQTDALNLQKAQASVALQKQLNQANDDAAESQRRLALKRAVAKQTAQFGGQGVGLDGGSQEAVLLGLFNESDEERRLREQTTALKDAALDQSVGNTSAVNLLQQSQLQERQNLERITDLL